MENVKQFLFNHWVLTLSLLIIALLILINEVISRKKAATALSPQEVVDKINHEEAIVLDIREKAAFDNAHILGAERVNAQDLMQGKMQQNKNRPLIIVCTRGLQSAPLAAKLVSEGYQAFVLAGGITAWQQAELPVHKN
jgi:rhodanese-related sulfurtransferase